MGRGVQFPVEYMMHLEAGFVSGKDGKAKKDIANVIPRVGRMITSSRENTSATPGKRRSANDAAYILAFWESALPTMEGVMSSKRRSHSGPAFRLLTLMSLEVKSLFHRHLYTV